MSVRKRLFNILKKRPGFSIVELLVVVGILSFVIVGIMRLFVACTILVTMSQSITSASMDAQNKMEEIRNHTFDDIAVDYASGGTPGNTFDLTQLTGKGAVYIDNSNPDLLEVHIVVCWRDRFGRVYGEDANLNGILDAGEDTNGDGAIDSIVTLSTLISEK